jgi:hypothetical protein
LPLENAKIFLLLLKYLAVPYYRITLHYFDGSSVTGIRQHQSWDVDFVVRYFTEQLKSRATKPVDDIEVVMAPKTAPDVRKYISRHAKR